MVGNEWWWVAGVWMLWRIHICRQQCEYVLAGFRDSSLRFTGGKQSIVEVKGTPRDGQSCPLHWCDQMTICFHPSEVWSAACAYVVGLAMCCGEAGGLGSASAYKEKERLRMKENCPVAPNIY